jgi:hypothetical protein
MPVEPSALIGSVLIPSREGQELPYDRDQQPDQSRGRSTMTSIRQKAAWVSLGLTLLLVCSSACSTSKPRGNSSTASGEGAVIGTLHLAGGPAPGTENPTSGEVYAFTTAGLTGTPIAKVKTGSDGSFSLRLPPGTYYLAATSPRFSIDPPPATPPCRGDTPAVVSRGSTNRVDVVCTMK